MENKRALDQRSSQLSKGIGGIVVAMVVASIAVLAVVNFIVERQEIDYAYSLSTKVSSFLEENCKKYDMYESGNLADAQQSLLDTVNGLEEFIAPEQINDGEFLSRFIRAEHIGGLLVLDATGNEVSHADMDDKDSHAMWADVLSMRAVSNIAENPDKTYAASAVIDDVPYNYVIAAYNGGLILCYESSVKIVDDPYDYTVAGLLENVSFNEDPVIAIADGDLVLSSNDSTIQGAQVSEVPLLQAAGAWTDDKLTRTTANGGVWFGTRSAYKNYTFYIAYPAAEVFTDRAGVLATCFAVCLAISLVLLLIRRNHDKERIAYMQEQLRAAEEVKRAQELTYKDRLTGLYNRNYMESRDGDFARAGDYPVSLIMADCNYLKRTNDTLGHEFGDLLLQRVAKVISESLPNECFAMRVGGDEFLIVCPHTPKKAADELVEAIRQGLADASDDQLTLSVSFGSCTVYGGELSFRRAYELADKAMYQEKRKAHGE